MKEARNAVVNFHCRNGCDLVKQLDRHLNSNFLGLVAGSAIFGRATMKAG